MKPHRRLYGVAPVDKASAFYLRFGYDERIVATAETKDIELIPCDVETYHGLYHRQHYWVVGPDAAIYQDVATVLQRLEISWGSGRGEADIDHTFVTVELVVWMVRGLENKNLAVPSIKGRNA